MRIAYVTTYDAREIKHFAGIPFFMARALQTQGAELTLVGGFQQHAKRVLQAMQLFYRLGPRVDHHRDWEPLSLDGWAKQISRALPAVKPDIILSPATIPVANLDTSVPIAVWSDATFAAISDYYPEYSNISKRMRRLGNAAEQRVVDKSQTLIYSSHWAAQSAIADYRANPDRVHVVPYGANLHDPPSPSSVRTAIAERVNSGALRLLWVARGWERKGGSLAIEVTQQLRAQGLNATLTMIGTALPPGIQTGEGVTVIPFLDKEDPAQRVQIRNAFMESHFFVLPTRADCTPIVFNEAAACGLPVISYDTGGIKSIVKDGVSGILLSPDSGAEAFTHALLEHCVGEAYTRLAEGGRARYEGLLNWHTAGAQVYGLLQHAISQHRKQ